MSLLAPRVDGPLSECSSSVRVEGQITGATVELHLTGHPGSIGGGVATWSDQSFPLNGGVHLTPGATVQALQKQGAEVSPLGPGITVQKKPPVIGPLAIQSHLYVCGQCLWLTGAVPGAKVDVDVLGVPRGSGISTDGARSVRQFMGTSSWWERGARSTFIVRERGIPRRTVPGLTRSVLI